MLHVVDVRQVVTRGRVIYGLGQPLHYVLADVAAHRAHAGVDLVDLECGYVKRMNIKA